MILRFIAEEAFSQQGILTSWLKIIPKGGF